MERLIQANDKFWELWITLLRHPIPNLFFPLFFISVLCAVIVTFVSIRWIHGKWFPFVVNGIFACSAGLMTVRLPGIHPTIRQAVSTGIFFVQHAENYQTAYITATGDKKLHTSQIGTYLYYTKGLTRNNGRMQDTGFFWEHFYRTLDKIQNIGIFGDITSHPYQKESYLFLVLLVAVCICIICWMTRQKKWAFGICMVLCIMAFSLMNNGAAWMFLLASALEAVVMAWKTPKAEASTTKRQNVVGSG